MELTRIAQLRLLLSAERNPADAALQQRYHKTALQFYGIKTDRRRALARQVFGGKPLRKNIEAELRELWRSDYWDERIIALGLLSRCAADLAPADMAWLLQISHECDGWALLDTLALEVLGPLALAHGPALYEPLRQWSGEAWLWTRRAAVLAHIIPARRRQLSAQHAWPTWDRHLAERDFFIRKAIGWALRETTKHYPHDVFQFLIAASDRVSGLTRREGARKLPLEWRMQLLGR
jgi:3-methyladenine DNA glycosylase AlkD